MSSENQILGMAADFFHEQSAWLDSRSGRHVFESPAALVSAYESKALVGAVTDADGPDGDQLPSDLRRYARYCQDEFRDTIGKVESEFATAYGTGGLYGDWKGQVCNPMRHYLKIDPAKAGKGAQLTGDCVSWAKRGARDTARCFDIGELKQAEEYVLRSATADLYSMRGHTGAGASPSRLAVAATKIGILLETVVEGPGGKSMDFSNYREYYRIGMRMGRTGLPKWVFDANREYGPKQVARIRTEEELLAALWNGCGVSVGSMIGVSKHGGHKGCKFLSGLRGSWPHDMQIFGFDDSRQHCSETIILWDQSWGRWNHIKSSDWPDEYGPMPEGAFALTLSDTMRAVRGGECHALSDSHGFRPRRQATLGAEGLV